MMSPAGDRQVLALGKVDRRADIPLPVYQVPGIVCRYLAHGSACVKSVHLLENLPVDRGGTRKRSRLGASRTHPKAEGTQGKSKKSETERFSKRVLIVVESEGAVFDTLAWQHEHAYLPAFVGRFSWGMDTADCMRLWRGLALSSKLRGQDPLLILLSALRLMNRSAPSIRRAAVIRVLDSYLATPVRDQFRLASAPKGGPERLILDWISMSDSLLREEGYAPLFPAARDFLKTTKTLAPGSEILAYSTLPEAVALNQWEVAEMSDCFLRIAGSERGDFSGYLRAALKNGYDKGPILVVGTTSSAWQAAQAVGARFYPVMPYSEEESWTYLSESFFPAFMQGESSLVDRDSRAFMRMMLEDFDMAAALTS
jgi:hypothetical protein